MDTKYRTLARLFHADRSSDAYKNHDRLAAQRLAADSTFATGITTPLGELFVATPRRITMLTQRILLAERRVASMWEAMPGVMKWSYITHAISEELFATNEMEGVRSTRKETEAAVAAARQASEDGDAGKARFGEFAKLYLNLTDRDAQLPKTLEDIRAIYDKVALDEIPNDDKPDGELFRKDDVEVQGPHGVSIHSGVSGETRIAALLAQMVDLAGSDRMPFLQRAIVSHFLFEYIHSFYDGNGRTGRYLLALYLNRDLTIPTVLSLSRIIAENKNEYYKAFTEAEDKLNRGELGIHRTRAVIPHRRAGDQDRPAGQGRRSARRTGQEAGIVHERGRAVLRRHAGGAVRHRQIHDLGGRRIRSAARQAVRAQIRGGASQGRTRRIHGKAAAPLCSLRNPAQGNGIGIKRLSLD